MMSLICFPRPESSGNNQTTHENRGGNPPHVTLDYIVKDLLLSFNGFKCLHETKKIEETCDIKKENGDCWSADDIKQVWKETQIMRKKSSRRRHWARVIMLQVLKTCLYHDGFNRIEAQSDLNKAAEITSSETEQVPEIPSSSETKNNMVTEATQNDDSNTITTIKEEECLEHLDQSLAELCVSNKENVKEQTMTENPPGGEKKVMVQQHPECRIQSVGTKRRQRVSQDFDTFEINNKEQIPNKKKNEKLERMEDGRWIRGSNKSSSQNVYIRIPLSVMSGNESTCKPEVVKNDNPTYKLIDRVPNLTDIRKKKSYVMLHDNRTRNAAWVYEILNTSIIGQDVDHQNDEKNPTDFKVDNSIHPFYQAPESNKEKQYTKDGIYDRGHLAAAANHKWCRDAFHDTYLFSNMAPQDKKLNRSQWKSLEEQCRKDIKEKDIKKKDIKEKKDAIRNIHVYTGPLYLPNNQTVSYKMVGDKAVPTHFFKVIIVEKWDDTVELKCYKMPNEELSGDIEIYKAKIEDIEKASGLIFTESSYNHVTDSMETVTWSENEHNVTTEVKISTLK